MSDSFWQRLRRGGRRLLARADWPGFAGEDWPDHILDRAVTDRFHAKQGRSTGRLILEKDGQRLVVYLKRHFQLPRWRGLLATFFPRRAWSPAAQEWRNLEKAEREGFPVPARVALCQYVGPWGRLQSVLAIEELADMLPLHEAIPLAAKLLDNASFARWKRGLTAEIARLTWELHRRRWFHKDLYLCHFYLARCDIASSPAHWQGRVHLIDLHRLGRHWWTWPWWLVKDLGQLLYSSDVAGVTARDRARFWRLYQSPGRPLWQIRLARWVILLRWKRYKDHNQKRKQRLRARLSVGGRRALRVAFLSRSERITYGDERVW